MELSLNDLQELRDGARTEEEHTKWQGKIDEYFMEPKKKKDRKKKKQRVFVEDEDDLWW